MNQISNTEHRNYLELIYLEPDGELTPGEATGLERHLAGCASCRAERRDLAAMNSWLGAATEEADPELARRVMADLPAAGWEARHPRAWRPAAAVFIVLALAATLVATQGGGAAEAPALGAARAVVDLLAATAMAGAGLLGASWQGLGMALGEVFGGSRLTLGVFALFVAGVDFLFVRYLLRQPRRTLAAARRRDR